MSGHGHKSTCRHGWPNAAARVCEKCEAGANAKVPKKFRKKPVVIEATQWFKNGDHPEDNSERLATMTHPGAGTVEGQPHVYEGKIVRYYRHPSVPGERLCQHCGIRMHEHGWIDTLEGGHTVCPGDWIITGVKGERYPCKPDIFAATYEPVVGA